MKSYLYNFFFLKSSFQEFFSFCFFRTKIPLTLSDRTSHLAFFSFPRAFLICLLVGRLFVQTSDWSWTPRGWVSNSVQFGCVKAPIRISRKAHQTVQGVQGRCTALRYPAQRVRLRFYFSIASFAIVLFFCLLFVANLILGDHECLHCTHSYELVKTIIMIISGFAVFRLVCTFIFFACACTCLSLSSRFDNFLWRSFWQGSCFVSFRLMMFFTGFFWIRRHGHVAPPRSG
jgi:hypothetical protein